MHGTARQGTAGHGTVGHDTTRHELEDALHIYGIIAPTVRRVDRQAYGDVNTPAIPTIENQACVMFRLQV